jgi:hypothetical protein
MAQNNFSKKEKSFFWRKIQLSLPKITAMAKYDKERICNQLKALRRILRKPDLMEIATIESVSVNTVEVYFRGNVSNLALATQFLIEGQKIIKSRISSDSALSEMNQ